MLRRFQLAVITASCLLATGSQWDVIQVVAWGRMIYASSRVMPVTQAVCTTFTPGTMCSICRAVDQAKRDADAVPQLKVENKIILFFQPVAGPVIEAPQAAGWLPADLWVLPSERAAPLLRPPRCSAA